MFYIIVKKIEERHNKNKEEKKNNISQKLINERNKYSLSHDRYLESQREEELKREEKSFKKYEGYVRNNYLYKNILIKVFYYESKKIKRKRTSSSKL